ncbi:MAG: DUF1552 domain-containing protein [Myxococcaceae bacterium]
MLALPVLPSLFASSTAAAQAVASAKCFVHMRTPHGGVSTANMWPSTTGLTQTLQYVHTVRRGVLNATLDGAGNASLSPVLTANANTLTPAIVAKMNVLRGLDVSTDLVHNFGGALGYYDCNKQRPRDPRATIDQIMAYSPAVYPSVASVRRRSVQIGISGSWGYNTPGVRSSGVSTSALSSTESSRGLFDTLLGGATTPGSGARPPIVDRVLESYKRLRNSNKRLSSEDRVRLDQHIDSVAELQRRLNTVLPAECVVPTRPSTDNLSLRPMDGAPEKNVQFFQLINEVLAVALNCGVTRVVSVSIDENNQALTFTTRAAQGEDWHNNVAHTATSTAQGQDLIRQFNQVFFSGVYMDLVARLNRYSDGAGGTFLDHSLVAWGQECGNATHLASTMPVITAGSAGGAIKTGGYCDYRNLGIQFYGDSGTGNETDLMWPGLLYNQWLTTALKAMGVPNTEWAETSHPGYGERAAFPASWENRFFTKQGLFPSQVYTDAYWQRTGELLPFL